MGAVIEIRGAAQVAARLHKLDARLTAPAEPLFRSFIEDWTERFRANIAEQHDVAGDAFEELSLETRKRRKKLGFAPDRPILQRKGFLKSSIGLLELGEDIVRVGSSEPRARLLQFGGQTSPASLLPNRPVPARPFIGLTDAMVDETVELIQHYYLGSDEEFDA